MRISVNLALFLHGNSSILRITFSLSQNLNKSTECRILGIVKFQKSLVIGENECWELRLTPIIRVLSILVKTDKKLNIKRLSLHLLNQFIACFLKILYPKLEMASFFFYFPFLKKRKYSERCYLFGYTIFIFSSVWLSFLKFLHSLVWLKNGSDISKNLVKVSKQNATFISWNNEND